MLDLAGADTEGERAECAMRRSMAVTAHDGRSRQCPALFRTDDVHDALANIVHRQIFDTEFLGVGFQLRDLLARLRIGNSLRPILGRHIVVGDGQRELRPAHLAAGVAQALERLRARHFMDEVTVDVEHRRRARRRAHQMRVPDLVIERSCRCHLPITRLFRRLPYQPERSVGKQRRLVTAEI